MPRARFRIASVVGLACAIACSGTDEAPTLGSGGDGSSGAGRPSASGGDASASGGDASASAGDASGGRNAGNGGVAPSGGSGAGAGRAGAAASVSGGGGSAGSANGGGGASAGTAHNGGSSAGGSGGVSSGGAGSGGKSSGGAGASGASAGNGGKGSGGSSGGGGGGACPETASQLCGMTAQHNQARATVNPVPATSLPTMSWDATVAAAAQAWADQCNFSHYAAGYGQNLYASAGGGGPSPTVVVINWVSEVSAYDYAANTCSGTCGHYTQVVWRTSTKLGCGFKACSTNSPFAQFPNWYIVVCNYSPPGNNGSRPY